MSSEIDYYEDEAITAHEATTQELFAQQVGGLLGEIKNSIEKEERTHEEWINELKHRIVEEKDTRSVMFEQLGRAVEMKTSKTDKLIKTLDTLVKASKSTQISVNVGNGGCAEVESLSADQKIALMKSL